MRKLRWPLMVLLTLAFLATAGVAVAALNFHGHATGAQEVPAVDTKARGQVNFKLSKDGDELKYKLNVAKIDKVKFAHIHLAPEGQNGPVVAFLLSLQSPSTGEVHGTLAEGTITAASLVGPLAGQPLSKLLEAIEAGNAYINVHTDEYPGGEIRAQIR